MIEPKVSCPAECKVELKHIKGDIKKCENMDDTLWEEVKMKVNQRMFFWMMGIAVIILLSTFGAIYHQGGLTLEKVQAAQVEQAKIKSTLESHNQNTELVRELIVELRKENGHTR
jgi:hypothetical protein